MRVAVLGAGVIGSVYAGKLIQSGHEVVMVARGRRLEELRAHGLILEDAESGERTALPVRSVERLGTDDNFDLVLVSVRRDQFAALLPQLSAVDKTVTVLFMGNTAGSCKELAAALGGRAVFGFPAVGGVRDGTSTRFVLIRQQRTMLGELDGRGSPRLEKLRAMLQAAGFSVAITRDMEGWLAAHAAFIAPIAFALYAVDTDAKRLAGDHASLQLMVAATREAFQALRAGGAAEIPANLKVLYEWMPEWFAIRYWRGVMSGPRGELWFAAHCRAAPEEMRSLAAHLQQILRPIGRPTPALDILLAGART